MNYLKVRWIHQHRGDPVLLMSELDTERYEVRKIEIFLDGRMSFASVDQSREGTVLSEVPIPESVNIALDPQFIVAGNLDAQEFEKAWIAAISGARWNCVD